MAHLHFCFRFCVPEEDDDYEITDQEIIAEKEPK